MSKTSCRREDAVRKTIRRTIQRLVIAFGALVEYHPISAKERSRLHQFAERVLPGIFLGYALIAGRLSERDVLIADIEELGNVDAREILARRLNANENYAEKW